VAFTRTYSAREDSGSANNPALNLTGAPAVELTFVAETDTGGAGDLILDKPTGGGVDPDTQVEIDGTSYSFTFELSGTMPTQNRDGAQQVPDQFEGSDVVIVTVQDYPSVGETTRFAFMPNESASLVDLDDFGNGAIDVQNLDETPAPTPVCFVKGTLILTPRGTVPIEELDVGDGVLTVDGGAQTIRWIGSSALPGRGRFAPVRIAKGALGNARDLWVSQEHRMLIEDWKCELLFGEPQVLVAAKSLIGRAGIEIVETQSVEYFHILFDRHEIIFAEGIASESLFPGPVGLNSLSELSREEIFSLFPDLRADPSGYGPTARTAMRFYEGRLLAA